MKPKRILTLLVLALFIVSAVPLALAQEETGETNTTTNTERGTDTANADTTGSTTDDAATTDSDDDTDPETRSARDPKREVKPAVARVVDAKRDVVRERKDLRAAVTDFREAKGVLADRRANLNDAKARLTRCRDADSEACQALRAEVREHANEFLLRSAEAILAALDRAVSRVTDSTQLTDAEKEDALADLNAKIDEITTAKGIVENLDGNSTDAEIREAAKTINAAWKRAKVSLNRHEGRAAAARLHGLLTKMNQLSERLENALAKLTERGLDTSNAESLKAEFDAKLASAQTHYDTAKETFNSEDENRITTAHQELRAMHADLKEAHRILAAIVKEIKTLNRGSLDVADDDDTDTGQDQEGDDNTDESQADDAEETTGAVEADDNDETQGENS